MKYLRNLTFNLPFLLLLFLALHGSAWALPWKQVPDSMQARGSFVQDSAAILSTEEIGNIDQICKNLEQKTSIELAVITVDSLEGMTIEEYAVELFRRLGIGKKGKDNGALILFALQDRKIRLEVGYGLEATLTDARSQQLLSQFAIPQFKNRQYAQGIFELTQAVAKTLDGEEVPKPSEIDSTAIPSDSNIDSKDEESSTRPEGYLKNILLNLGQYLIAGLLAALFLTLTLALPQGFMKAQTAKLEYLRKFKVTLIIISIAAFFIFVAAIVFGIIRWIYPLFIILPLADLAMLPIYKILKRRAINYRLICPQCHSKTNLVPEFQDDQWLSDEEVDEEIAKGMNYEFWSCPQCTTLQRFNVKLGGAKACPQCHRRSLVETSKTLRSASTVSEGLRLRQEDCKNRHCNYFKEWQEIIPRRSSSSGSSGFSSGSSSSSFGGGRSGGGGASGSW